MSQAVPRSLTAFARSSRSSSGYSLAFGPDMHGVIGSLANFGLRGVGFAPDPAYAATIPALVFMIFQAMFAIITPALIIGAFVERIKFSTLVVFTLVWATLVYDPVAHWVWSPLGWLHSMVSVQRRSC